MKNTNSFLVHKTDLFQTSILQNNISDLDNGEVLLQIEKFAFTTNNVTYAVAGHTLKYWNFFPAEEPWGIIPAWGFAKVVATKNDALKVGQRFYGYLPMSSHLKVLPGKISSNGFIDFAAHRKKMAVIYNSYQLADANTNNQLEDYIPIVKPLFATSFLNYHFLKGEAFFDADQIILTSASSKTALGLAFLLKQNQTDHQKKIIALTSKGNVDFVSNTGFYDQVLTYENYKDLAEDASTVVDFAGNGPLLKKLQTHFFQQLKYISLIGLTDWKKGIKGLDIPQSKFFFAPSYAQKFVAEFGPDAFMNQLMSVMQQFIYKIKNDITISEIENLEGLSELYAAMLKGDVDPSRGYIVTLTSVNKFQLVD